MLSNNRRNALIKNTSVKIETYVVFSLVPIFSNMQKSFFQDDIIFLGLNAMTWMGISYCIGAGMLFTVVTKDKVSLFSKYYSIIAFSFFITWIVVPQNNLSVLYAVLFMFFFAGCAAIASLGFTYTLNDTEKLFGAILTSMTFSFMELEYGLSIISSLFPLIF